MPLPRLMQPKSVDDMLLYMMGQVHATAGRHVVRMCETEFGITRREWRLLAQLARGEGLPSSALADRAGLDRARTSRTLSVLVNKRLVRRSPRQDDRREVHLYLTEAGSALYAALLPRVAQINQRLVSALNEREAALLDGFLLRLQAQAERMGGGEAG